MGLLWGKRVRATAMSSERVATRGAWQAEPARERRSRRGPLHTVVLHHTSVPAAHLEPDVSAEAAYVRELQRQHFERAFADIGYHFVVVPSGRIFLGRPVWALGAHVAGHNTGSVGIALGGDFNVERPTQEAIDSTAYVLSSLVAGGSEVPLVGHSDLAPKDCPGRFLYPYVKALGDQRATPPEAEARSERAVGGPTSSAAGPPGRPGPAAPRSRPSSPRTRASEGPSTPR
jgi:N-acetylmuramoyl-L-alanine amidase